MSDPWSSLQAPGVVATDSSATGIAPAYCTLDDRGRPIVGFDAFMELPPHCLKCGESTNESRAVELKVREDLVARMLSRGNMSRHSDRIRAGVYNMQFPMCSTCKERVEKLGRTVKAVLLGAIGAVGLGVVVGQVAALLGGAIAAFSCLVVVPLSMSVLRGRVRNAEVHVGQIDSSGYLVLTGIDQVAGEAIVAASLAPRG